MNWNQIPRIPQRDGYGQGLLDLCAARPDVVVLDADVAASTRTNWVRDRFPDHFYNLGISEQDLVGTAAGLALGGQIPYVSTYGVFLSGRAFDQIRTTVCYNNLKVRFGGAHAGISVGPDGATHQALEDLALARVLPHMTVIAPCDSAQTRKAVLAAVDWPGPVYFRFGREAVPVITDETTPFTIGKARLVQRGRDCAVLACGAMVYEARWPPRRWRPRASP
ncbi:MAG: transketolase family protein [Evtepia gabavorous]